MVNKTDLWFMSDTLSELQGMNIAFDLDRIESMPLKCFNLQMMR